MRPRYAGLVSVILPTYNRAELIGRAIASVIAQSYSAWELIVVDDASTDDTAAVVAQFADQRIAYLRLPINCGHPSRPRNIGWQLARGTYIAYIDDDNAWRPQHLERLVAAAEANPDAAGAYGGRCHHLPTGQSENIVDPDHGIDTGDGLHRRDLLALLPEMWTETNFTNEDLEFWARLRQRHPIGLVWVPEVLSDYYIHDGNRYFSHWLNFRRYDRSYFQRNAATLDDPARCETLVALVQQQQPRTVLDVGCGRGWVVRALRAQGVAAWGVDAAAALRELSLIGPHWLQAPADRLPFADGQFDVVLCAHVLEHIPEPFIARSLHELLRVCGGQLVAVIDYANAAVEGHVTIRPPAWWAAQLRTAGATAVLDQSDERQARLICRIAPAADHLVPTPQLAQLAVGAR